MRDNANLRQPVATPVANYARCCLNFLFQRSSLRVDCNQLLVTSQMKVREQGFFLVFFSRAFFDIVFPIRLHSNTIKGNS